MRIFQICTPLLILTAFLACGSTGKVPPKLEAPQSQGAFITTPSGLGILDLQLGEGASPRLAQSCVIEVLGWVEEKGQKGKQFLDTRKRGYPAVFPVGVGRVIPGWDEGVLPMKKGGRRLLRVPAALGYSEREGGADIPLGATLLFDVQLIDLR